MAEEQRDKRAEPTGDPRRKLEVDRQTISDLNSTPEESDKVKGGIPKATKDR